MQIYAPGARIAGRYEVAGRPMLGGMGIVYVCHDLEDDRPVVLKTFRPEYLPDRAARDRFLREGTHWVDLGAHPHIVRCYNVLYVDPRVFLVLELVPAAPERESASLRAWLEPRVPLSTDQALLFALQIARGMKHAVKVLPGFVHRDLKPENLLVGADRLASAQVNRLRVTDLGLASVLEEAGVAPPAAAVNAGGAYSLRRTRLTRGIVGTPLYMAPEQWRGERATLRSDVYAMGCVLYEMLAGQPAAGGRSLADLQRAHCSGHLRPLPPGIAREVNEVVAHCLALDADARYERWQAVETALGVAYRAVTGDAVPAPEPPASAGRAEGAASGWSYNTIGVSYGDLGKARVAVDYFDRARAVGESAGDSGLVGAALGNMAIAYAQLNDPAQAIRCHEQALAVLREIQATSGSELEWSVARSGEGATLGNLGGLHLLMGDLRRAIDCQQQALAIHREMGNAQGEGNALGNLGEAYCLLGDVRRAVGHLHQAMVAFEKVGDVRGLGNVLDTLANLCAQMGDVRGATDFSEQRLAIARDLGDRRGEGSALGNLGCACLLGRDARRAVRYLEQSLAIHREIGDRRGEASALLNLGGVYLQLGDARRAVGYHEQALTIHRQIGDRKGEAQDLGSLGNDYKLLGDARRAIQYCRQAISILDEIGDTLNAAGIGLNLALILFHQGRLAEARPYAESAAQAFGQVGNAHYAQQAQQLLSQIRARLG